MNISYEEYVAYFNERHPDFFTTGSGSRVTPGHVCEEMVLFLQDFDPSAYPIPLPDGVTFGYYAGDHATLLEAVGKVSKGWVSIYEECPPEEVYCGYQNGVLTSFCLVDDFGELKHDGKLLKVGGPGCVGTVPEYRRRGIGLSMIRNATQILKERGCDVSYIHYTGVAPWYAKLGYETVLRWTNTGFLPEEVK